MGGLCSRSSTVDNAPSGGFLQLNGHFSHGSGLVFQTRELKIDSNTNPSLVGENNVDNKQLREPFSFPEVDVVQYGMNPDDIDDGIPRLSRALSNKSRSTKSTPVAVAKVSLICVLFTCLIIANSFSSACCFLCYIFRRNFDCSM
jgi:hypothetical protein